MGWRERHDVTAAVELVRRRWHDQPVGVVGWSLGGAAALLASPLGVEALVLESVYPTLSEAVHNRLARRVGPLAHGITPLLLWQVPSRLGVGTGVLRPIDKMGQAGCPVLLLAGDRDQRTTRSESLRMAEAGGTAANLALFPGAGHVDLLGHDRERWLDAVIPHLRSALGRSHPAKWPMSRETERAVDMVRQGGMAKPGCLACVSQELGQFLVGALTPGPCVRTFCDSPPSAVGTAGSGRPGL